MAIHKGKRAAGPGKPIGRPEAAPKRERLAALEAAPYALALACLALFAIGAPFPVPRFALPLRSYEVTGLGAEAALSSAAGGPFCAVELRLDGGPTMAEVGAARRHYRSTGMPVALKAGAGHEGPVAAWSLPLSSEGSAVELTILLDAEAASGPVEIAVDGAMAASFPSVPPDRRVKVTIRREAASKVSQVEVIAGDRSAAFGVAARGSAEPRILVASDKLGGRSAIEALFPVRRVPVSALGGSGFHAYDLVVLDGPDLRTLDGGVEAALAGYVERGAGSLLLVADSPELGGPGDAPEIERLLPVELSPRSLSRLPDVAMAVAIDASGSMYGEKLSLAKAVGLELVRNLKPSDQAGILLFDDGSGWLRPLGPVGSLDAEAGLEPLRAGGGTRLYPAVDACLDALAGARMPERRLVVVSDGLSEPADFDALIAKAFKAGVPITAMAVGDEYDRALLTRLAAGTGGRFYRVKNAWDVPSLIIEDRRSVSRTVFAEETVGVVDVAGRPAGSIAGMARLSPKPDALAFFSSQAGDPLLAVRRAGSRSTMVYASDLYGRYGMEFLARPATLSTLRAVIGGALDDEAPEATLTCDADGITLSISGDRLVAPSLAVAGPDGRLVAEAPFAETAPGRFAAGFDPAEPGVHALLVEDRGRTLARYQAAAEPGVGARRSDAAAVRYRTPFWALARGRAWWLAAFFAFSMAATLASRLLGGGARTRARSADAQAAGALATLISALLLAPVDAMAQAALSRDSGRPAPAASGRAEEPTAGRMRGSAEGRPRIRLDAPAPRPWAFNGATVSAEGGLAGDVGIVGLLDDGAEVELFAARGVRAGRMAASWYGDGRLVAVYAYERGRDGQSSTPPIPLDAAYSAEAAASSLSKLSFPYRPSLGRPARGGAVLVDASPDGLAKAAAETLFRPRPRRAPALALSVWAIALLGLAWVLGRKAAPPRALAAPTLVAVLAGAALAAILAATVRPGAELYTAEGAVGGTVELKLAAERRDGYLAVAWSGPGPEGPAFIAVRSPISAAVPVSAFSRFVELRFRLPPLVEPLPDGTPVLAPAPFAMAWGLDG